MVDETLYITPHEAALAVVATAMKKARLKWDILIINSIVGGVFFSAGGMLALCAQGENPTLNALNPGIVHFMQGIVFPIGLFYVIAMGAELYNSNVLYFSVAVCRGAVSIFDLLISWFVSWTFNFGGNLFVCYVICHLSGVTSKPLYKAGAIAIAEEKFECSFIETFIKGVAGNFCVCLSVYLQLLAKPFHVKLLLMGLPIFTFVSMGFTHVVADMYLIPMGMIEGAAIPVGTYIWKTLLSATLGNAVGGCVFSIIIPFYLHLVVVERDRKLLKLPEYEAKDEQPELQMDSRVVRVTQPQSYSDNEKNEFYPSAYRPEAETSTVNIHPTLISTSRRSNNSDTLRSPPGVFPVMGMGEPLTRERTIAGSTRDSADEDDGSNSMYSRDDMSFISRTFSTTSKRINRRDIQKNEEENYTREGGYNARENALGESLKRVITRSAKKEAAIQDDPEIGLRRNSRESSIADAASGLFRTISNKLSMKSPESLNDINDRLHKYNITKSAAQAADSIAGIDNYAFKDQLQRPPAVQKNRSYTSRKSIPPPLSPIHSDNNNSSSESSVNAIDKALNPTDDPINKTATDDAELISNLSEET